MKLVISEEGFVEVLEVGGVTPDVSNSKFMYELFWIYAQILGVLNMSGS
jgi:hypothetical protein